MFRRMLVPLDGSPFSEAALPVAVTLARKQQGEIRLLFVVEPTPGYPEMTEAFEQERAEHYLAEAKNTAAQSWDGPITTSVRNGPAAAQITAEAEDWGADLLVMATHGRRGLSRAWMGSVADRCIRTSARPVLAVRPPTSGGIPHPTLALGHVVVPLDGSAIAETALPYGVVLAKECGVPLVIVRAVTPPRAIELGYLPETIALTYELEEEARKQATAYVRGVVERLTTEGVRVTGSVISDRGAAQAIVSRARGDLVVMSTHGRGGIDRTMFGSTTDKVVRSAGGAVLVIPPRAQQARDNDARDERVRTTISSLVF